MMRFLGASLSHTCRFHVLRMLSEKTFGGEVRLTQPTPGRILPFSFYFTDKWNAVRGIHQTKHKKRQEFKLMDFLPPPVEARRRKFRHVISVHWTCLGATRGTLFQSQTQDSHYEKTFPYALDFPPQMQIRRWHDEMIKFAWSLSDLIKRKVWKFSRCQQCNEIDCDVAWKEY